MLRRAIHDLDIMDKHRALLGVAEMVSPPDLTGGNQRMAAFGMSPLRDGMVISLPADHANVRTGYQARGKIVLRFPLTDDETNFGFPLGGGEIVPELFRCAILVEEIIEAFTRL